MYFLQLEGRGVRNDYNARKSCAIYRGMQNLQ